MLWGCSATLLCWPSGHPRSWGWTWSPACLPGCQNLVPSPPPSWMCRCRGKPIAHGQVPKFLCVPGDSPPPEAPRWHPGTRELPRLVRQQETFLGPRAAWSDGRTSVLWGWVSLGKGMRRAAWIFRELVFTGGCVSHVPDTPAGTSTAQPGLIGPEAKSQIPAGSVGPCAAGGGASFGNHQTGESRTLPCSARGIGHSWASPGPLWLKGCFLQEHQAGRAGAAQERRRLCGDLTAPSSA